MEQNPRPKFPHLTPFLPLPQPDNLQLRKYLFAHVSYWYYLFIFILFKALLTNVVYNIHSVNGSGTHKTVRL